MRAIILLSAMIGVMFAIPTLIILLFILPEYALQISLLAGCFAFIFMSIFLAIYVALDKRKYDRFESKIRIPVFCKVNGNFRFGKKVRNGNVYFCEEGVIIIALLDEKPYIRETLLLSDGLMLCSLATSPSSFSPCTTCSTILALNSGL